MILMLAVLLVMALPDGGECQDSGMKIMLAGKFNFQSISGGGEASFVFPVSDIFFVIAQGEANQAVSGLAGDSLGKMYGADAMLGATLFKTESISFAITGGLASQWYAFLNPSAPVFTKEQVRRNYIEGKLGALLFWEFRENTELFVMGQYYNPIRENALNSEFGVTVGIAVPIG